MSDVANSEIYPFARGGCLRTTTMNDKQEMRSTALTQHIVEALKTPSCLCIICFLFVALRTFSVSWVRGYELNLTAGDYVMIERETRRRFESGAHHNSLERRQRHNQGGSGELKVALQKRPEVNVDQVHSEVQRHHS